MKVRQGFVSNSSSSSFVVAFPEQPKSVEDVLKMMFPGASPDEVWAVYDESKSYKEIADRVWLDIEQQLRTESDQYEEDEFPLTVEKLTDIFRSRYYFLSGHNIDFDILMKEGRIVEIPNCRSCKATYFGTEKGQLEEACKWEIEKGKIWEEYARHLELLREKLDLVDPPYDHKASDKDKEKRDKICSQNDKKLKASKEYSSLFRFKCNIEEFVESKHSEAIKRLAETDAKAYLEANYDAFLLYTSYADDCEAFMEHGDIFQNLPHVRISHH